MALLVVPMVVLGVAACSSVATPAASSAPATAVTREAAIAAARAAAPMWVRGDVISAVSGTFGDLGSPTAPVRVSPAPGRGRPVWRISLGSGSGPLDAAGADVVVDAHDGTVIQFWEWVS